MKKMGGKRWDGKGCGMGWERTVRGSEGWFEMNCDGGVKIGVGVDFWRNLNIFDC